MRDVDLRAYPKTRLARTLALPSHIQQSCFERREGERPREPQQTKRFSDSSQNLR